MTTEEAFQAALDAEPDNHTLREIFADWLDDMGDPRAEGYRALGVNGLTACDSIHPQGEWLPHEPAGWFPLRIKSHGDTYFFLPDDWYELLEINAGAGVCKEFANRRVAEDEAASVFPKLPAERRAELLRREPCPA